MDGCNPLYKDAFWSYYRFEPSIGANAVFVALFGISATLHIWQMCKTRSWYLTAFVIGCLCEAIGYLGRVVNAREEPGCWTMGPYVIQNLLILIAPAFMAASIYMILGRIILLTDGEKYSLVKRRWLTKMFVSGDLLSIFLQGSGGGLMAAGEKLLETGENVIIGGLFVQLFVFGGFMVVAATFHRRMARLPTIQASDPAIRWRTYLMTLYMTGTIIWARSLFRVVEFIEGNDGHLMRSEGWVFGFDAIPMLFVVLWVNWFHPSEIGLLLNGEDPIRNGLQLIKMSDGTRPRRRATTMESLASEQGIAGHGA